MPEHVVQEGEYLAKIARQYGFPDFLTIWNHARNAPLKAQRKNPNVLNPGDVLWIPEKELREENKPTDNKHKFEVKKKPLKLRIKVRDVNGNPVRNTACTLVVDGTSYSLTTDGSGLIQQEIPPTASTGRLVLRNASIPIDLDVTLDIGHLDPVEERNGQQARLNNLGYYAGEPDTVDEVRFRQAVEEFQRDQRLEVDGICGPITRAKLKEVYGS